MIGNRQVRGYVLAQGYAGNRVPSDAAHAVLRDGGEAALGFICG